MLRRLLVITLMILSVSVLCRAALIPPDHPLFEEDAVHEIRLTFHQNDWWDSLRVNFEGQDDPQYLSAEFDWETVHFDSIGVRFKGNSSYSGYPGVKKSFKLDFDEFIEGQEIDGLDKLNLNNAFNDPSFVREACAYKLCEAVGLPTVRTNFAALYINNSYWGLYTLVEQFDQEFIESRFGAAENGNLWKGDPHGTLEYRGPVESSYYDSYELENHEDENDWSVLVELADVLNNTPLEALPDSLHNILDVNSALAMLAIDVFTVNLDSYIGRCCNYYFYHRDLDDRFVFVEWDLNEAWGVFNSWGLSQIQLRHLDPHWTSTLPGDQRPLAERLWQIEAFDEIYLGHMLALMAGAAHPDTLVNRMIELRSLIQPFVYSDVNKMFSNTQFDIALTQDVHQGPRFIPGLEPFIRERDAWLRSQIGEWNPVENLVLNELMADNRSTAADEHGDFDDWIEIVNTGSTPISLMGLGLTDHMDGGESFVFPDTTIAPGEYLLVWADEEPEQGNCHASFRLDADGEDVYLIDGGVIINQITFSQIGPDVSYGRWPDGNGEWQILSSATPGEQNENTTTPEEIFLCINEFLALNEAVNQDEAGEFEDWVEIYNPDSHPVQMGGLFLTDDLSNPTKWMFPDTMLGADDFLLVWCDNDPEDGPLHTGFALSGGGEEIGIFGRLSAGNEAIDSHSFEEQTADVSEGRLTECGDSWDFFQEPTPGGPNSSTGSRDGNIDPAVPLTHVLYQNYPNPFNPVTTISFYLQRNERVNLTVYNQLSRIVAVLVNESLPEGCHSVLLDGSALPSGVYFYRLTAGDFSAGKKMVILK